MEAEQIENQIINSTDEDIQTWAFIEIFGHQKVAGRLTTRKLGTQCMFQVDVPKGETEFSHSELYGPASIFSIKPTTEAWCRKWAKAATAYDHSPLPYIPETRQIEASATPDNGDLDE